MNHVITEKSSSCAICGSRNLVPVFDFGMQPVCSRFLETVTEYEMKTVFSILQCHDCGLIQNPCPPEVRYLKPGFDWIRYREPENHLDDLADYICRLNILEKDSFILGLSTYDAPLIRAFKRRGFTNARLADPVDEYGIKEKNFGVETVQEKICCRAVSCINREIRPELVIAGFILEHVHDFRNFIQTLGEMVSDSGFLLVQVPDFGYSLDKLEYTGLWEEHVLYFTETVFNMCMGVSKKFSPVFFRKYAHDDGVVLAGLWQADKKDGLCLSLNQDLIETDIKRCAKFQAMFAEHRASLKHFLSCFRSAEGKIALFGAGHQACIFANLFELEGLIEFAVDDDINKQGMYLPGSHLEIKNSQSLVAENIRLCLTAVSKRVETIIAAGNEEFAAMGGRFESIDNPALYGGFQHYCTEGEM